MNSNADGPISRMVQLAENKRMLLIGALAATLILALALWLLLIRRGPATTISFQSFAETACASRTDASCEAKVREALLALENSQLGQNDETGLCEIRIPTDEATVSSLSRYLGADFTRALNAQCGIAGLREPLRTKTALDRDARNLPEPASPARAGRPVAPVTFEVVFKNLELNGFWQATELDQSDIKWISEEGCEQLRRDQSDALSALERTRAAIAGRGYALPPMWPVERLLLVTSAAACPDQRETLILTVGSGTA